MSNVVTINVFISRDHNQVSAIVDNLKKRGLDAIFSSEANKPYAVKVLTSLDEGSNVLGMIQEAIVVSVA